MDVKSAHCAHLWVKPYGDEFEFTGAFAAVCKLVDMFDSSKILGLQEIDHRMRRRTE